MGALAAALEKLNIWDKNERKNMKFLFLSLP